jgi:class 3 adenylate cyclase
VVGDIGVGEQQAQLAMGDTPNIASGIQGLAVSDTVAISEATARLLSPVCDWFTEGFDTADLQEAKTLLNELRA